MSLIRRIYDVGGNIITWVSFLAGVLSREIPAVIALIINN